MADGGPTPTTGGNSSSLDSTIQRSLASLEEQMVKFINYQTDANPLKTGKEIAQQAGS